MSGSSEHLYPHFDRLLPREWKEKRLGQKGHVFWLYGLSGSGKSTLALALEKELFAAGYFCQILDGDNVRTGLNRNLGFSDEDRLENIRRVAEVAKLFAQSGIVVLCSFITPKQALRDMAREIIGERDFTDVYVKADYETCARRDPKGLYAKVQAGQVKQFTGKDSGFEEPQKPDLLIDTEIASQEECLDLLKKRVLQVIKQS